MKILCVEDGSIDVNAIENGDLQSGKVLIYRQNARVPFVLDIPLNESHYEQMWKELKHSADDKTKSQYDLNFGIDLTNLIYEIEKKFNGEKIEE